MTLPLTGVALAEHEPLVRSLPDWGYTDVWSSEVTGADAFTPLVLAAGWAPTLRLGTAIVPVFTRGPGLIAMSAAALAELAPGRFVLGLGASSPAVVNQWNSVAFDRPLQRTADVLRIVRAALAGERVSADLDTVRVEGLRLERPPAVAPPILLAALRPQMLALAGREADGAILNWLAPDDVAPCLAAVDNPGAHIVARVFVCPTEDAATARAIGRRLIAAYLTVPAYAAFHEWLGRGPALTAMQAAWAAGDRAGALTALDDDTVDELVVHGAPERCRERVAEYAAAGVDVPVLALVAPPELSSPAALADVVRRLGPGAHR
ncbi:MAG: LLM class F420-dependent oxidoreductase [bacterium]